VLCVACIRIFFEESQIMTFAQFNFNPNITKAIQACGYNIPTPIQLRSIPDILEGKDLVASAQTGTGKTAAFILPALQRLSLDKSTIKPRVLVLTPTRELAAQIIDAAERYGKFLNFNMVTLIGGASYRQQLKGLSRPCDIIVATPGRLLDHMENKKIDLSAIEMLILDEADRMLDMGFIDDVKQISKATPHTRQTLLFSATVDEKLSQIVRQLLKNPVRIDLSAEKMAPINIKQELYIADSIQHKTRLLQHFLTKTLIYKAIIFSATKVNADKLTKQLRDDGLSVAALHGDLKQAVRNRTIEQFRRGKIQYLVATDVASRGIDVSDVTHVINYDLPKFSEDYVHRIGRTGRAGKTGIAISFALPIDNRHLQKIERYTKQRLELLTVEGLEATRPMMTGGGSQSGKNGSKKKSFRGKSSNSNERKNKFEGSKKFSGSARSSDEGRKFGDKKFGGGARSSDEGRKFGDKKFGGGARSSDEGRKFGDKKFGGGARLSDEGRKFGEKKFGGGARSSDEGRKFSDKKFGGARSSDEGRKFGDKKFGGGARSSDEGRKFGDKKFGGGARSSDEGRKFGDKKFGGGARSSDEGRKFGDKKFGGGARSSDEGRKFGDKKFGGAARSSDEGRKFGDKKFGGKARSSGDQKKFGDKSLGKNKDSNKERFDSPFSKKKANKFHD
jgi:superfamily II DNA/RNA helicase